MAKNRMLQKYYLKCLIPFFFAILCKDLKKTYRCVVPLIMMLFYHIMTPLPLTICALIPCMVLPFMGLLRDGEYPLLFLEEEAYFLVPLTLFSEAFDETGLYERLSLYMMQLYGVSIRNIIIVFMIISTMLSPIFDVTPTYMILQPIADHTVKQIYQYENIDSTEKELKQDSSGNIIYKVSSLGSEKERENRDLIGLSLSFALTICSNLYFSPWHEFTRFALTHRYPNAELGNFIWFKYQIMGYIIRTYFFIVYFIVYRTSKPDPEDSQLTDEERFDKLKSVIADRKKELGALKTDEIIVLLCYGLNLGMWFAFPFITSNEKIGHTVFSNLLLVPIFLFPKTIKNACHAKPILNWNRSIKAIPWKIMFLFCGVQILCRELRVNGFDFFLSDMFTYLGFNYPFLMQIVYTLITTVLVEFINRIHFSVIMNQTLSFLITHFKNINPLYILLPVSSAINSPFICALGSNILTMNADFTGVTTRDMLMPGMVMKTMNYMVELFMINTWGIYVFKLHIVPAWANVTFPMHYNSL